MEIMFWDADNEERVVVSYGKHGLWIELNRQDGTHASKYVDASKVFEAIKRLIEEE